MLGIERGTSGTENGTTNLTVTVTNRFAGVTLTSVDVRVGKARADLATSNPLAPGEADSATFPNVSCDSAVHIDAQSEGVRVTITRSVPC